MADPRNVSAGFLRYRRVVTHCDPVCVTCVGAAGKAGVKFGDDVADTPDGDADLLMKDSKEAAMALKVQEALKREADESSGDSGEDILVAPPPKTSLATGMFRLAQRQALVVSCLLCPTVGPPDASA
jgi:hypothetical protein